MNANNYVLDKFFKSGPETLFSFPDILMTMIATTLICIMLAYTYRATHRGTSYSSNYILSMFLMGVATSVVMIIIGSNIARAFSLVGALSIIRFRTAVKDPRDTAFLFLAIVCGMGAGTGFYLPVIMMACFLCLFALVFDYFKFGTNPKLETVLKVTMSQEDSCENTLGNLLGKQFKDHKMINRINNFRTNDVTNVYVVKPSKTTDVVNVEAELKQLAGMKSVSLYNSDQHAPF